MMPLKHVHHPIKGGRKNEVSIMTDPDIGRRSFLRGTGAVTAATVAASAAGWLGTKEAEAAPVAAAAEAAPASGATQLFAIEQKLTLSLQNRVWLPSKRNGKSPMGTWHYGWKL
jgi:hypothetical protein